MFNPGTDALDAILDRQKQAWLDGSQPSVEELLRGSSLPDGPETRLDLIYNEIVVREELGDVPSLEEYACRYPDLQEDLKLHFEVHRALNANLFLETARAHEGETDAGGEAIIEDGASPELPDYEILGELGRGGMGVVYKARHLRLKRLVALKMFRPGGQPSARELERFRAEAEAIARLQHPNIVQIFEVGQVNGLPFLALELAETGTLRQKLEQMPMTPRAAAALIETLARALQHAHDRHIVHRDLKPANVLFAGDGTPKITDFGLAKSLVDDADSPRDASRSGEPIGTPRYMAPEQVAGQTDQIGPATDVYGLGTTLYECMTNQVPFLSTSVMETMERIRHEDPSSPRRFQPAIPRDLETICLHCLHKLPGKRYDTTRALAEDLRRFLNGEPIRARRTPHWERAKKWCFRHPARAGVIAMAVLWAVTGLMLFFVREHRLAGVRQEVIDLVAQGKVLAERRQDHEAKILFQSAMAKAQSEPALRDLELMVAGWLDHSQRGVEQQRWKQRTPPPPYDERRDEAFLQSILIDPRQKESLASAREAIQAALEFAISPAEREQLLLLDANMLLHAGEAANALAVLERSEGISSRLWHNKRADCLERLKRNEEAGQERLLAAPFPPEETLELVFRGIDHLHGADPASALQAFGKVLSLEPDHFIGRFFQAACLLRLKRSSEAKIALTACIAQRPLFVWNYLFRGDANLRLGDPVGAAQDYQRARAANLTAIAREHLDHSLEVLNEAVAKLPDAGRKAFGDENILTDAGLRALRELPGFQQKGAD